MVMLQTMAEHRAVDLVQQSVMYLDREVGPNTENVLVVGGVVNLAQR